MFTPPELALPLKSIPITRAIPMLLSLFTQSPAVRGISGEKLPPQPAHATRRRTIAFCTPDPERVGGQIGEDIDRPVPKMLAEIFILNITLMKIDYTGRSLLH